MSRIFARNFRGFKDISFDIGKTLFLVGDNSSGKSSILHLTEYVCRTELLETPSLNEDYAYDRYDFFSPYFNNADVTIGFISETTKKPLGRLVTLTQSKHNMPPQVLRFTAVYDSSRLTFVRKRNSVFYKIERFDPEKSGFDELSLLRAHNENKGFHRLDVEDNRDNQSINSLFYLGELLAAAGKTKRHLVLSVGRGLTSTALPTAWQTGPLRGLPDRFYDVSRKFLANGRHFATMWHDLKIVEQPELLEPVLKFGRESQLFENLSIDQLTKKVKNSPLLVTVKKGGRDFLLSQVGIGVSQAIPFVIESAFRSTGSDGDIMLLQQPELHLHPIAQAALGEFLYSMCTKGIKYIIETHSDFLIDRYRVNMKENATQLPSSILFCENTKNGNNVIEIPIRSDGSLDNAPENYKDFFIKEIVRTMF